MSEFKTVTVTFQLRVPRHMTRSEIATFVESAIRTEPGNYHPTSPESGIQPYRKGIEVFMP